MAWLDNIFGGLLANSQAQPQAQNQGMGAMGGMQSPNMDWQKLLDIGVGLMEAGGPSSAPISTGQGIARGLKYANEQATARNDAAYKNAIAAATLQKANIPDLEVSAQQILAKKFQGLPVTPQEEASLQTWDSMNRTKVKTDALGNPMPASISIYDILSANKTNNRAALSSGGVSAPPLVDTTPDIQIPAIPPGSNMMPEPPVNGDFIDAGEGSAFTPSLNKELANLPPIAQKGYYTEKGQNLAKKEVDRVEANKAWPAQRDKWDYALKTVDIAMQKLNNPWVQGAVGSVAGVLDASAKASYDRDITEIKSKLAIDEIRKLKDSGASLGQITEREWPKIESGYGAMDAADPEQAARGLQGFRDSTALMMSDRDLGAAGVDDETRLAIYNGDINSAATVAVGKNIPVTMRINGTVKRLTPDLAKVYLQNTQGGY